MPFKKIASAVGDFLEKAATPLGGVTEGETRAEPAAPAPVDCFMSDWAPWSECSVTCGEGTRYHDRTVVTEPAHGGMECGTTWERKPCAVRECVYMDHTHATRVRDSDDIFDQYDENLDERLTIEDLEHMMKYLHIWKETKTEDKILSYGDIAGHTQNYAQLWEDIINSILKMEREDPTKISEADLQFVKDELDAAQRNFDDWKAQMEFAKKNLGMDPSEDLDVTPQWLREHAQHAVDDFASRLGASFHRLGGREDREVHQDQVDEYGQYVALMLSIMRNAQEGIVGTTKKEYKEELKKQNMIVAETLERVTDYTHPLREQVGPLLGRDDIAMHADSVDIATRAPLLDADL